MGWGPNRVNLVDGTPFKRVRVRFHRTGGACVVSVVDCPVWFEEGFMPEVPNGLARRLDIMLDRYFDREQAGTWEVESSGEDDAESMESVQKKRKVGEVTPEVLVKEEEVS